MSYTVYAGTNVTPPAPVPWDAAGVMSTYYPRFFNLFEAIATPKWLWRMAYMYHASATSTNTLYLPPILGGQNTAWKFSETGKASGGGYCYPYSTSYSSTSVTISTSEVTISPSYRWFAPFYRPISCASWGNTNPLCVDIYPRENTRVSSGSGFVRVAGKLAGNTPSDLWPAVPSATPTGLSTAHYNAFVREVQRAVWTPVLHSTYWSSQSQTETVGSVLGGLRFPICYDRVAPEAQRTLTVCIFSGSSTVDDSITLLHGDRHIEAPKVWPTDGVGSFAEYRCLLDPLLNGESPDCIAGDDGRSIYQVQIKYDSSKTGAFKSISLWAGVQAP